MIIPGEKDQIISYIYIYIPLTSIRRCGALYAYMRDVKVTSFPSRDRSSFYALGLGGGVYLGLPRGTQVTANRAP